MNILPIPQEQPVPETPKLVVEMRPDGSFSWRITGAIPPGLLNNVLDLVKFFLVQKQFNDMQAQAQQQNKRVLLPDGSAPNWQG